MNFLDTGHPRGLKFELLTFAQLLNPNIHSAVSRGSFVREQSFHPYARQFKRKIQTEQSQPESRVSRCSVKNRLPKRRVPAVAYTLCRVLHTSRNLCVVDVRTLRSQSGTPVRSGRLVVCVTFGGGVFPLVQ